MYFTRKYFKENIDQLRLDQIIGKIAELAKVDEGYHSSLHVNKIFCRVAWIKDTLYVVSMYENKISILQG